jgi:hypothetical protein
VRLEAGVRVTNVLVQDSGDDGVRAARFARGSSGLSVMGSDGIAVSLTHPAALNDLPVGGTIEDNDEDTIHLTFNSIQTDVTIKAAGVPYVQEDTVNVHDIELVIEAGVEYHFAADAFLDIGWNSNATELHIEGEEAAPVVFRGAVETKGYYQGLRINQNVLSSSTVTHTQIWHGGGLDRPALDVFARVTLQDVTLEDNLIGMRLERPLQPASSNLTITGTDGVPLTVHPNAITGIPAGGSFSGNDEDEILVEDSLTVHAVTGLVPDLGVPFRITNDIELTSGSDVEIAPGTEIIMAADIRLLVGWNSNPAKLVAVGTSTEPILFVGQTSTAGYWNGITFSASADATSELEYVTIANAGKAGSAALVLDRAISVTNTTIDNSAGAGIEKTAGDATDYSVSNTFTNVAQGNVITD